MKRANADPTAWRSTPEGRAKYSLARADAQRRANDLGFDHGLEAEDTFRTFRVFILPARENRCGHELRCEVVHCEDLAKVQPGHGFWTYGRAL